MRANPIRDLASCASCYHLFNALSAPKSVKDVLRLNNAYFVSDVGFHKFRINSAPGKGTLLEIDAPIPVNRLQFRFFSGLKPV